MNNIVFSILSVRFKFSFFHFRFLASHLFISFFFSLFNILLFYFAFFYTCSSISSFQLWSTRLQWVLTAEPLQMHHIGEMQPQIAPRNHKTRVLCLFYTSEFQEHTSCASARLRQEYQSSLGIGTDTLQVF